MDKNRLSIIIPVYNAEEYLDRCLHSIIDQGFTSYEVILVDDGSTDSSPLICDRYSATDPRFRTLHKPNGGVSSARNAGLELAKGEYIMFLDSDDWIDEDFLEKLYNSAKNNSADISVATIIRKREYAQKYRVHYTEEKVYKTLKDLDNCLTYNTNGCQECEETYFVNSETYRCDLCSSEITHCKKTSMRYF